MARLVGGETHRDCCLLMSRASLLAYDACSARNAEEVENVFPCTPLQDGMMAETLLDPQANVEQLLVKSN